MKSLFKKMDRRVVIDATPLLYTTTGIGRATRKLVETMLSLGSEYEIFLFGRRLQGRPLSDLGFGANSVHLRLPRASEWFIKGTALIELLCCGELYHATDFYLPLRHPEYSVATIHDLIFLVQPEQMVDHVRLSRWVPKFAKRCRRIITISESSKKDIIDRLDIDPELIDVIYWGVDRDVFYPPDDRDKLKDSLNLLLGFDRPYFLAVSCSLGRKNTPLLLEAYAQLARNSPQNDLVLVWEPTPDIYRQYNSSALVKRIHFIGRQSDKNLRDLYGGATAVVFPSLYEGFGFPILEGMSCGAPVITSNVTSMPEIGNDAALYVDPSDMDSIVSALEMFENQASLLSKLREKGLRRAAQFSWERCARETLTVYGRCLNM
jgi:glycosyltransferase involved in cell wall biosynthesis